MDEHEFLEVGDVVRLNSEPSRLTVESVDGKRITVVWFDCDFHWQRTVFQRDTLTYIPPYEVDPCDASETFEDDDDD